MQRSLLPGFTVPLNREKESEDTHNNNSNNNNSNNNKNDPIVELRGGGHVVSNKSHKEEPQYSTSVIDVKSPIVVIENEKNKITTTTREETVQIVHFTPEEMSNLKKKFVLFLQENFNTAYALALQQAREHQFNSLSSDEKVPNYILLFRQAQEQKHQTEKKKMEEELTSQFNAEQRRQRQSIYQKRVKVLEAQERERRVVYQQLLEQYYTHREEERRLNNNNNNNNNNNINSTNINNNSEEIVLNTSPESMTSKQVQQLRQVLYQLQMEVKSVNDDVRRSLSWREISVSNVAAKVQQQYQTIIAEQQEELNMLQKWHYEMKQLEKDAEESIAICKGQQSQRCKHLEGKNKQNSLPCTSNYDQGENETNVKQRDYYRKGLFDFIL